jgi:predicted ester cyclase
MKKTLSATIKAANSALIAKGRAADVGDYFAAGYSVRVSGHELKGGHSAILQVVGLIRSAFPDIRVKVDILVEGDKRVAWQRTLTGTHDGAYKGFPASGKQIVWRDMVTSEFRGGLIVREWVVTDLAEQLLMSRKR